MQRFYRTGRLAAFMLVLALGAGCGTSPTEPDAVTDPATDPVTDPVPSPNAGKLVSVAPAAGGDALEEFYLDTRGSGVVRGEVTLEAGRTYLVYVEGTWSAWDAAEFEYGGPCMGTTEADAAFPSPDFEGGQVGVDAAFVFAAPYASSWCDRASPATLDAWRYRGLGEGEFAFAPRPGRYRADHRYAYRIEGAGQPLEVLFSDQPQATDNYGQLRFTILTWAES